MRPFLLIFLFASIALAECHPYTTAGEHLGETTCIKGRIVKIGVGRTGVHFLDFCEDYRTCSFTIIVFPRDLRDVGDVRALEGKEVEVAGQVKSYNGQNEIILRDRSQLHGQYAKLPKLPKGYDAEKKGRYSAGTFSSPRSSSSTRKTTSRREPIDRDD